MPQIRPQDISNCVRLANEFRTEIRRLVPKDGAVDAGLPFTGSLVNAVVKEAPPDEHGVSAFCSQDDLLTGSDKALGALS
jgi:hypothetical protein